MFFFGIIKEKTCVSAVDEHGEKSALSFYFTVSYRKTLGKESEWIGKLLYQPLQQLSLLRRKNKMLLMRLFGKWRRLVLHISPKKENQFQAWGKKPSDFLLILGEYAK
ncbi:MAG: hypothetical protein LUC50_06270 [Ruminococcus sp.]|nr:hypothetical protein [Ruminococcus sp.]